MNITKNIWTKTILIFSFLSNALLLQANEVEIDLRNLEERSSVFVTDMSELSSIPESGVLKIKVENLPSLIKIVSIVKSKVVTHKTIWLTGNILKINGSIADNTVELSSTEAGKILADDIENEWHKIDLDKNPEYISSKPFLVYIANKLQFQKTDYLNKLVEKFSENELDFWAGAKIITYLENLENIGFNPLKNQFEHIAAINKNGEKEVYNRIQGSFLLIDFSSSGCRPCLEDIDELVRLKDDFSSDLEILSIWDDRKQDSWLNTAKKQKDKIVWTSLRDESLAIFEKFEINSFPTYLLIDPTGQVVKKWKSPGTKKLRKYLKRNISKK